MHRKIVLVTGSSDGIGKQTAMDLARLGAHVIVHGRDEKRTDRTRRDIETHVETSDLGMVSGDLASFDEIRAIARTLHAGYDRIDVLINNAGVYKLERLISQDGIEMTFAVNHLSYFLLTGLLLDLIERSAYARIVNVASQAHASTLDFENLQGETYFEGYDAYARSKLCNILFSNRLARLVEGRGISVNALHPGVISTKLLHAGWGSGGAPVTEGARTSVFVAASPEVEGITGSYFSNSRRTSPASIAKDTGVQDELWRRSAEMTGFDYAF